MQNFNVNLFNEYPPMVLYAKQGDSLSRFFTVTLLDNGAPFKIPEEVSFSVRFGAPGMSSGWYDTITETDGSSHSAFSVDGNVVTVELAEQVIAQSGVNQLCLMMHNSGGYQLTSWNICVQIQATPGADDPEATQYFNLLSELLDQVNEAADAGSQSAEQAAQSASSAASSAASAANSASQAQQSATNAAQSATQAETAASHYPYVGEDGYWYVFDVSQSQYVKTEYPATGPQGPQGPVGPPLHIAGSYATEEALAEAFPTGDGDNAYLVNGIVYVWDGTAWAGTSISGGITPYAHQKSGTVNALTGAEGAVYISWSMTATYEYGETWTLNGTPVTVQYCDGSLAPPHQLITGDLLVGKVSGSVITLTIPAPASNKNLLDNWYFLDPINQRGQTSWSGGGYHLDRWYEEQPSACSIGADGYHISPGQSSVQKILGSEANQILGKTVTISCLLSDGSFASATGTVPAQITENFNITCNLSADVLYQIAFYPSENCQLGRIVNLSSNSDEIIVVACKTEFGPHQTLVRTDTDGNLALMDSPPSQTAELLKCQRYYLPIVPDILGSGATGGGNTIYIMVPIPVQMISTPSAVIPPVVVKCGQAISGCTYTGNLSAGSNCVRLQFSAPEGTEIGNALTACAYTSGNPYLTAEP